MRVISVGHFGLKRLDSGLQLATLDLVQHFEVRPGSVLSFFRKFKCRSDELRGVRAHFVSVLIHTLLDAALRHNHNRFSIRGDAEG